MSDRALRTTMIVLATIGLGVASYLTYVHYSGMPPLCSTTHNTCLKVQTSIYSKLAGVPVALIGLIGYVVILASLLAPQREQTRFATMAFTLAGFGFSAYLTGREAFSLHEYCEWCLSSAAIMTVLACLSTWRFLRGAPAPGVPAGPSAEADAGTPLAAGS
ncbi:MAG TPA: vitamin K epoxide reductase family protein [Solirubrobacteraceae bacterium]|jgi:uncharacterized membrane protein|nr:vitamin K epoxide reductase family protein [Solirubrobacteraceae bacterium]